MSVVLFAFVLGLVVFMAVILPIGVMVLSIVMSTQQEHRQNGEATEPISVTVKELLQEAREVFGQPAPRGRQATRRSTASRRQKQLTACTEDSAEFMAHVNQRLAQLRQQGR